MHEGGEEVTGSGKKSGAAPGGGVAGWLLERLSGRTKRQPRLALLERIALAPKQSLALVEAEGRRFLIATSADGAPAFYALGASAGAARTGQSRTRASW